MKGIIVIAQSGTLSACTEDTPTFLTPSRKSAILKSRCLKQGKSMPRPTTKEALLEAAEKNFKLLWETIDALSEKALQAEFDFSADPKKKEAHWKRDKNLRDILIHLYEWHQLLSSWMKANLSGTKKNFLPEPYSWKTYGEMNFAFWKKHQKTSLEKAKQLVKASHESALKLIVPLSNEALFSKNWFDWTGTTTLGSYCVSALSSHYDWAIKKLRAHSKNITS